MKKFTLFTAGILSIFSLSSQALTVNAASLKDVQMYQNGNFIIISGNGSNCNPNVSWDDICEQLKDQLGNICPPSAPETDAPETSPPDNTPDTNIPGTNAPDTNAPGPNPPDNSPDTEAPGTNAPETDPPGDNTEDSTNLSFIEQVVKLVNTERAKEGLSPLSINKHVQAAAQVRAQECELSFSHTRPDGRNFATALKEQNVSYRRAGENIAWGQKSPEEVVNAWMNSSGHRANIMNPNFTSIGVGYYQNAKGINYWSQLFIG